MPAPGRPAPYRGWVEDFDAFVGLGTVRASDGRRFMFHCTRIADGSRSVETGAPVEFDVVAGQLGQWEAAAIRPCSG